MSFESMGEFFAMGGHGLYVWLSYGAALVVVAANVVSARNGYRRLRSDLKEQNQRVDARLSEES